ncbi:unnamed protein product [Paramecium octaurelia]|uniref:Tetratricopeptide repeat protein n=1 Tax=Paramecium octaurelia TaxID=43137 RepID=A0A8S1VCU3_PAROT|nr:unnamed protein product [Paramecium octaurelia]
MPSQIDVFQLTYTSTDEEIQLCVEWIKTQLKAKQTVTLLVKKCQRQELIPQVTVDIVTMIQQRIKQLSQVPQTRLNEVQELLQIYNQKGVKNQTILIQLYIELANAKQPEAQDKAIELLCKVEEKIRKQFTTQFSQFLKEKIKQLIENGQQEANQQNQKEALALYQKAQELNNYYEEKDTTVQLNIQLGNAYHSLKQYDEALNVWEKSIKYIQNQSQQQQFQNELIYMYNTVGQIYYDKKQNNKATQYWDSAISILEQQNEQEKLEQQSKQLLGHLLNNVGMIYYQKGEVKRAISNFQKTIEVYESIYGKGHISVGNRLNNLGEAYRSDKQYDKALEMFNQALSIKKAELQVQPSKSLASTINNIGMTLQNKQSFEEAIDYFKQALQMYNEPGVFSDPNAGDAALQKSNTMHSIAECYRSLHNLDLCIQYFRDAYKYKAQELKIFHKSTQNTAIQLASALFQKNQFEESLKIFEVVLDGQKQVYGQDSQIVAQTINNIGTVLSELKQYQKALDKVQEAIRIFEKKLDKSDHYLQKAYENMKNIKQKLLE